MILISLSVVNDNVKSGNALYWKVKADFYSVENIV